MPELSIGCEASYSGIRCCTLDHLGGGFLKTKHQNFIHRCLWFPRPLQLRPLQPEIKRCGDNCISHITSTCKAKKAHKRKNISRPFHFVFKHTQRKRRNQQPGFTGVAKNKNKTGNRRLRDRTRQHCGSSSINWGATPNCTVAPINGATNIAIHNLHHHKL